MSRRRFSEREVIRTLVIQGAVIFCFRTREQITLENVGALEREHLHEVALGGPDVPANCRYSLKEAHKIVTNGTKATTAGSSKHKLRKCNPARVAKFVVHRQDETAAKPEKPKRKMRSRGFSKEHRPFRKRAA